MTAISCNTKLKYLSIKEILFVLAIITIKMKKILFVLSIASMGLVACVGDTQDSSSECTTETKRMLLF